MSHSPPKTLRPVRSRRWPQGRRTQGGGRRLAVLTLALSGVLPALVRAQEPNRPAAAEPLRLHTAWKLPKWLDLRLEQRTRFEHLDQKYKAGQSGFDQQLALRTLLFASARFEPFDLTAELIDARAYLSPDDAALDTTQINALELLQGYLGGNFERVFGPEDELALKLGRQTLDLGNRRLVARNAFRNTINNFTGLHGDWNSGSGMGLQAFYFLPVNRLPNDPDGLDDNEVQFDEELDRTRLAGLEWSDRFLERGLVSEVYALNLDESDQGGVNTRDRQLWTLGTRLFTDPLPGKLHFEWESAFQFGESRSTTNPANTNDLDHAAQLHHLTLGYQLEDDWKTRIEGLFDYASGDEDPTDGSFERFDTLYGARRFEFGPTGILGLIPRANLISPGARAFLQVSPRLRWMFAHRLIYLASERDAWTTANLVDASGASGRYVGQATEFSVTYELLPKNLWLEFGMQHLFAGSFVSDVPNATGQDDPTYVYLQTTLRL